MPKNRKYFPNKSVVLCATRTETGLPLVPSLNLNFILWGILARAQEQFDVSVCHFVFLGNHFHMMLVVRNPSDVSKFIGYIKAESAHAVNRLLARPQRTIWQDGYDSPLLLTPKDAMKYIRYIYLNPARADLSESIYNYAGISSWEMFTSGNHTKSCKRLSRDSIKPLWSPALSINEQKRLVETYQEEAGTKHEFKLEPNAWMECFPELKEVMEFELNTQLKMEIEHEEKRLVKERRAAKRQAIGVTTLRRQSMTKEYEPSKRSRRMICISHDRELRHACIEKVKALSEKCREVYQAWKRGEVVERIPAGMFAPHMPVLVSALSLF